MNRAFSYTQKTIDPILKLYQFEYAIWWYVAPHIINTFLESYDLSGKDVILFATSGGSGFGKTVQELKGSCNATMLREGKVLSSRKMDAQIKEMIK